MRRFHLSRMALLLASLELATATARASAAPPAPAVRLLPDERRFAADFDAFLSGSMQRFPTIVGLSVAVARSHGPIYVNAYGQADREGHLRATRHTRFYIASSTKSFVALAFTRLAQSGQLNLDWTLAELAPHIHFAPEIRANEVTLRHLLSHSHGLDSPEIEFRLAYSGEHDPATLWRLLGQVRPNPSAPLGTFAYSNLGYNIAALLIERRLGRPWQELLEAQVLRPMRLRETMARGLESNCAQLALPYAGLAPGGPRRVSLVKTDATMQSAGGIYSSALDMAHWVQLQLAAETGRGAMSLSSAAVAATHAPFVHMDAEFGPFARTGYGLGWYSGPYRGETLYHSFGGYPGTRAHTSFLPSRDIGVAINTNDDGVGFRFVDVAAAYVYDWFIAGRDVARRNAAEALTRLEEATARRVQSSAAARARRAARQWRFTLAPAAYRGRYCSSALGTMWIGGLGNRVDARMGILRSVAAPFDDPDSIRLELVPGDAQAVQFKVQQGRVTGLETQGFDFSRCG